VPFIGEYLINKPLPDPSTPSLGFEDAQHTLSIFYKCFFTMLVAQNKNRVFVPSGEVGRSDVGKLESIQPRMSMDPVMFYIPMAILGFQLIAVTIIFAWAPGWFLPRFPYSLTSEISFFHGSSALSDVAGIPNMSSVMPSRHLKGLRGMYGYGSFRRSDGERHVGIQRMSLLSGYKQSVVTTSESSTIPETTAMVRTVAAVPRASSSPLTEGAVSTAGDVVVPVLAVGQIGAQAVSAVDGGTRGCARLRAR